MNFKTYKLDFGWEITVPEGWIMEKRAEGSCIFYPDDPEDESTIYVPALHSEDHKLLSTDSLLKSVFERGIPENSTPLRIPTNLDCTAFTQLGRDGVFRIGAGFYTEGELLSLNVYAKSEQKAYEAAGGFSQIKFTRGGKNAV